MQKTLSLPFPIPISIFPRVILKRKFSKRIFWIFSYLLFIFLLSFYVFQINSLTSNTYLFQSYEKNINEAKEENTKLEIQLAELNSLENLEKLVENLNYERAEKVKYIQVLGGEVVIK